VRKIDGAFWLVLSRLWSRWADVLVVVKPDTVVRWHRAGFRLWWRWKSRSRAPAESEISTEVKALIRRMAEANEGWGAPRIHGELLKLGIDIGERSVSRFMPPRPREPLSQIWRTFLDNHVDSLASIDFFTVLTATFRVLYVLFVLSHDRRRVLHFNLTEFPSAHWTGQQIIEAFPEDSAPRYMLRDRDGIYGDQFQHRVEGMGIEEVLAAPRSPWQNPYAERLVGSVRRECRLLSPVADVPVSGEGRACAEASPAAEHGHDRGTARGRRPPSPVRAPRRLIGAGVLRPDAGVKVALCPKLVGPRWLHVDPAPHTARSVLTTRLERRDHRRPPPLRTPGSAGGEPHGSLAAATLHDVRDAQQVAAGSVEVEGSAHADF
jgi:hypothetical protein